MTFEKITLDHRDGVGIIRLSDPNRLNAVTLPMIDEIGQALDEVERVDRAMILTGAGRAFCSGAELKDGLSGGDEDGPDLGAVLETHINPLMTRLRNLSIPWISAVRGPAAGVGCSLALAADMVVADDTAYFLQAFARIGLVPDGGSSHLLARGLSRVRAMELMLLGDRLPAALALEWGLANRVVPDGDLEVVAFALAARLAAGPTRTLALIRTLAWEALDSDWNAVLATERVMQRTAGRTRDATEGIAAFVEKRPALFEGR